MRASSGGYEDWRTSGKKFHGERSRLSNRLSTPDLGSSLGLEPS
eukprot:COSAG02_NODE_427_length_22498_cov_11.745212_3_plen_44_part_00